MLQQPIHSLWLFQLSPALREQLSLQNLTEIVDLLPHIKLGVPRFTSIIYELLVILVRDRTPLLFNNPNLLTT